MVDPKCPECSALARPHARLMLSDAHEYLVQRITCAYQKFNLCGSNDYNLDEVFSDDDQSAQNVICGMGRIGELVAPRRRMDKCWST